MTPATISDAPLVVITASDRWAAVDLKSLWYFRELLYFLAWRDVKVRYKQTLLGVAWAILQPLITMLIFSLFFGRVAKLPSDGHPYPLFAYSGLLPWTFFANAVTNSGTSLIANSQLVSKVYFPRLLMPVATIVAGLVDFAASLAIVVALFAWYRTGMTLNMLLLPFLVLEMVLFAVAVGTFCAALSVKYRDVRYALPFLIQLLMFATPIIYPASMVPHQYRWVLFLNPMATIVEAFRICLLGGSFDAVALISSTLLVICCLLCSLWYFRTVERHFADVV